MLKLLTILFLLFLPSGLSFPQEENLEVKGKIQADSLILPGGTAFPATPVKGEVFYRSDSGQKRFYTFDGQGWSGGNDKTVATKIVAAFNSLDASRADYPCTGTDDQTTIQTAINALGNAKGGVVYLLEGTYNLSGPIIFDDGSVFPRDRIDDSGKSLIGAGGGSLIRLISGTNLINATNVRSLLLGRLSLDGNGSSYGISFDNVSFSKIDKLWIRRISLRSIDLTDSPNNTISNCRIEGGGGSAGISLMRSNNNLIQNNYLQRRNISVRSSSQNRLLANSVSDSSGYGILLTYSADNNIVSGNNLRNNNKGIALERDNDRNLISQNLIQSSTAYGIDVWSNGRNNIILANTISAGNGWGVRISGGVNNFILANLLSENRDGGILITLGAMWPDPNSNFLFSNRISSSFSGYGIDIDRMAQDTYLAGNLIDGPGYAITGTSGPIRDEGSIAGGGKNTRYTDKTNMSLEPVTDTDKNIENSRPASYVRIDGNGAWTIENGRSSGDILVIEKILPASGSATFSAGGNLKLPGGAVGLGQNDTLTLIWDGAFWVEVGYSNN